MRGGVLRGGWLLVCASCALWAQSQPAVRPAKQTSRAALESAKAARGPRLLNASDGLAVLGAALETRHKAERSDCSHLVHAIYEKAGFPFKYQSSSDLYAGGEDFQRVWQPQAGDLIVWPGHAGIVVNPAQHTFYSALRSGFGVQPYDSVYWKGRGRPHFLRYIKSRPAPVLAARRVVGVKPTAVRSAEVESLPASTSSRDPDNSADEAGPPIEPAATLQAVPPVVAVRSAHPSAEQVKTSLAEHFQTVGEGVHTEDPLNPQLPMVAFDRLEIQKVHMKGDIGWTQVRFRGFVVLGARNAQASKSRDVQRFMLRRAGSDGWEIILPTDAAYLPRDIAVRTLAHQLAALTDSAPGDAGKSDERIQLARWLDLLLARR
jgi:hypothetical protein